jgi:hypothetical protein
MEKISFDQILAGFFVTLFLLGIIICAVYIVCVLAARRPEGKPFMRFFSVKYYREVSDPGDLKKKPARLVYRRAGAPKKIAKKPAAKKRRPPAYPAGCPLSRPAISNKTHRLPAYENRYPRAFSFVKAADTDTKGAAKNRR